MVLLPKATWEPQDRNSKNGFPPKAGRALSLGAKFKKMFPAEGGTCPVARGEFKKCVSYVFPMTSR